MSTPRKGLESPQVTVSVTQDIIDTSTRADSSHCMIADALRVAVPDAAYVSVDLATIRFSDLTAGRRYVYLTPRHAQAALLAFDQGEKPEPFTLRLRGAHVLPTGTGRKARAELKRNPGGGASVPVRVGGSSPPAGALSNQAVTAPAARKQAVIHAIRKAVAANPDASRNEIARIAGVSPSTVAKYRQGIAGGEAAKVMAKSAPATGRRREFGLRAIIR